MLFQNPVMGRIHPFNWTRPVGNNDFKVTQKFGCTGYTAEPPLGNCAHFHRGIDISNRKCGSLVLACRAGVIAKAGPEPFGALVVRINHGNKTYSEVAHLATIKVVKGQKVVAGQIIGTVGKTGAATACHVHFAIKTNLDSNASFYSDAAGTWINPWPHLEQNQ